MLSSTPRAFVGSTTFRATGTTCGHCQRAVTVTASRSVDRADIAAAVDEADYRIVP